MNHDGGPDIDQGYRRTPRESTMMGGGFFAWIRSLGMQRSSDRWIGGVSGAIANRIGWDPLIIRIIWLAFFCAAGFGALLYGLAWMLLPDERDGTIILEEAIAHGRFPAPFWVSLLFVVVGCPGSIFAIPFLSVPIFVVLIVAAVVLYHRNARERERNGAGGRGTGASYGADGAAPGAPYASAPSASGFPAGGSGADGVNAGGQAPPYGPRGGQYRRPDSSDVRPLPPQVVYRRRPAGPAVVGITAGMILLSLAAVIGVLTFSDLAGNPYACVMVFALWLLAVTFVLGVVTIVVGFVGRKSGGLIPLTILALFGAICAYAMIPAIGEESDGWVGTEYGILTTGDAVLRSSDLDRLADGGLEVVNSAVTLDLRDWGAYADEATACPGGTVDIDMISGTLNVLLPENCAVVNDVDMVMSSQTDANGDDQHFGFKSGSIYDGSPVEGGALYLTGNAIASSIIISEAQ